MRDGEPLSLAGLKRLEADASLRPESHGLKCDRYDSHTIGSCAVEFDRLVSLRWSKRFSFNFLKLTATFSHGRI
jgi:hypothetical protein